MTRPPTRAEHKRLREINRALKRALREALSYLSVNEGKAVRKAYLGVSKSEDGK